MHIMLKSFLNFLPPLYLTCFEMLMPSMPLIYVVLWQCGKWLLLWVCAGPGRKYFPDELFLMTRSHEVWWVISSSSQEAVIFFELSCMTLQKKRTKQTTPFLPCDGLPYVQYEGDYSFRLSRSKKCHTSNLFLPCRSPTPRRRRASTTSGPRTLTAISWTWGRSGIVLYTTVRNRISRTKKTVFRYKGHVCIVVNVASK